MTLQVALRHAWPGFTLDVAFAAPPGVTALYGRSGSGKTTIVNAVAGLLRPGAGRIVLGDRVLLDSAARIHLPAHRRRVGYVFQDARLFPHLDVADNLLYGRRRAGLALRGRDVDATVALLGLDALLTRRVAALSGGEAARVAIGRALLADPALLLLDEPLAALDTDRKAEILPWLERLRDAATVPILYVSHSIGEIARLATTLVTLEAGRVTAAGPVAQVLSDPAAVRAVGLRAAGALLTGRVVAHHSDGLTEVAVPGGTLHLPRIDRAPGAMLRLRIVAQDVIVATQAPQGLSALNILRGTIADLRGGDGPGMIARIAVGDAHLLARLTRRSALALDLRPGMAVHAIMKSVAVDPGDVGG